jgi:hypothetical protein
MPVDFARVLPRLVVPETPRLFWPLWAVLFAIFTSAGVAFSGVYRTAIKSSSKVDPNTSLISLDTSIGDCGIAGSWVALALASQQAMNTAEPQLVLVQEGEELIALTCKKHT